jgi:hypothetical protein
MRSGPLVVAAALLLALVGCVPTGTPSASPRPTATPVFASDAEALAAAEKAYAAYLKVSDEIANDGGKDPERITAVSTGTLTQDDLAGFESFSTKGWHSVGQSRVQSLTLQSADTHVTGAAVDVVAVYLCENVSAVDVVDSTGVSVVSASRPDFQQFEITFDLVKSTLLPSDREPWTGPSICR